MLNAEFEIANCDMDSEDPTAARKLQKAGREKQRRCRLNEQFIELGNTLGKLHNLFILFFMLLNHSVELVIS